MSHSPEEAGSGEAEGDYLEGWLATEQQVREGLSWSGLERHCAHLNLGDARFVDMAEVSGLAYPEDGRGLSLVDWDQDGDLDIWLRNRTTPGLRFMRNGLNRKERSLTLLLEGSPPNTGAIGATVELHATGTPWPMQRRSVRAGTGYISQSTKRLHFGLGDEGRPRRVVVRWPDGSREELEGLQAGRLHRIVQGSGRVELLPEREVLALAGEPLGKVAGTEASTLHPLGPLPLPELGLLDHEGRAVASAGARDRPMLLLAWATWCIPCHGELRELSAAASKLEEAGVDLRLVSVDTAPEEPTATPEQVRAWLEANGVPFESTLAAAVSVTKLELLEEALVNRKRPLALPSSLLVDSSGEVVSMTRGPTTLEGVLADLELAGLPRSERVDETIAADGLWVRPPRASDLAAIAGWFAYRGFQDDAVRFQRAATGSDVDRGVQEAEALRSAGRLGEAETRVRTALETEPQHAGGLALLGTIALQAGRLDAAESLLLSALAAEPRRTAAWINLSHVLSLAGKHEQAVDAARRASLLEPWNPEALHAVAAVELTRGADEPGIRALRATLSLDPTRLESAKALVERLDRPGDELEARYWAQRIVQMEAAAAAGGKTLSSN